MSEAYLAYRSWKYARRKCSGLAFWRCLYWMIVRRWDSEICEECGRPVFVPWWCHDDKLWTRVTGKPKPKESAESAGGTWCITCFDAAARLHPHDWFEWAPINLRPSR